MRKIATGILQEISWDKNISKRINKILYTVELFRYVQVKYGNWQGD
jgi:hypothetical protein